MKPPRSGAVSLAQLFLLMLGLLLSVSTASAQKIKHVVIDAGHGGRDPGAQTGYGQDEKLLAMDLAQRLEKILKAKGIRTTMTRSTDVKIPNEDRAAIANAIPDCVLVSLHFNSHGDRSISGIESFYFPGSVESEKLCRFIQGELGRRVVTRNRGAKPRSDLVVLNKSEGPAVLVECGFISHRWESQRCNSTWFRQVLAEEIAQALVRYISQP
ncbi:MAG: N-acetylmuramoyl-L-alanine amidase [Verrucomicrobiota bacterium]